MESWSLIAGLLLMALATGSVNAQDSNPQFNLHIGAGIGVPAGSTANFAGISGTFQVGAGPNFGRHSSIVGEYMWHGLPPNRSLVRCCRLSIRSRGATNLSTSANLNALTANYMFHMEGHQVMGTT